jgi:hypothetical protein
VQLAYVNGFFKLFSSFLQNRPFSCFSTPQRPFPIAKPVLVASALRADPVLQSQRDCITQAKAARAYPWE